MVDFAYLNLLYDKKYRIHHKKKKKRHNQRPIKPNKYQTYSAVIDGKKKFVGFLYLGEYETSVVLDDAFIKQKIVDVCGRGYTKYGKLLFMKRWVNTDHHKSVKQ